MFRKKFKFYVLWSLEDEEPYELPQIMLFLKKHNFVPRVGDLLFAPIELTTIALVSREQKVVYPNGSFTVESVCFGIDEGSVSVSLIRTEDLDGKEL